MTIATPDPNDSSTPEPNGSYHGSAVYTNGNGSFYYARGGSYVPVSPQASAIYAQRYRAEMEDRERAAQAVEQGHEDEQRGVSQGATTTEGTTTESESTTSEGEGEAGEAHGGFGDAGAAGGEGG